MLEDSKGKLSSYMSRYLPVEDLRVVTESVSSDTQEGSNVYYYNFPDPQRVRLNVWHVPTGAMRWSFGIFLVTKPMLESIFSKLGVKPGANVIKPSSTLVMGDGREDRPDVQFLDIFPLPPRPVAFRGLDDAGLWMLPLVDARYYWQFAHVDLISEQEITTNDELLTYLASRLPFSNVFSATSPFNSNYLPPSVTSSNNNFLNTASLLDTLAYNTNTMLVPAFQPYPSNASRSTAGAQWEFIDVTKSNTEESLNRAGLFSETIGSSSGQETRSGSPMVVCGDTFGDMYQSIRTPERVVMLFQNETAQYISKQPAASFGVLQYFNALDHVVKSPVDYVDGDEADLDTHAAQYAGDFYSIISSSNRTYDYQFAGMQPWQPTCFTDCVMFSMAYNDECYEGTTRAMSLPYNFFAGLSTAGVTDKEEHPGVILGYTDCYLGNGWYRVRPATMLEPVYPALDLVETWCSTSVYIWSEDDSAWTLETACSSGCSSSPPTDDGSTDGERREVECLSDFEPDPCKPASTGCLWQWDEPKSVWVKLRDGCSVPGELACTCTEPPADGDFDGQECTTECTPVSCSGTVTWTWTEGADGQTDYWLKSSSCIDTFCDAPEPAEPDPHPGYGTTTTTNCQHNSLCDESWDDPPDLCDVIDRCPTADPDSVVSRQAFDEQTGWVLAYHVSKMTLPDATQVVMSPWVDPEETWNLPEGRWNSSFSDDAPDWAKQGQDCYQIVEAQLPLQLLQIPNAFACCPDGSIKVTSYATAIIEGFACRDIPDPCPEEEETAPPTIPEVSFSDGFSDGFDSGYTPTGPAFNNGFSYGFSSEAQYPWEAGFDSGFGNGGPVLGPPPPPAP